MAPQAKIAFQDLGDDTSGTIYVPSDLVNNYFPLDYARCSPVYTLIFYHHAIATHGIPEGMHLKTCPDI